MKYISLFAGIGGFDLALNKAGHECVYVNEWDQYAVQTYEKNFRNNAQPLPQIVEDEEGRNRTSYEDRSEELLYRHGEHSGHRVDTRSITDVPASEIPDHDLLVGGFPCQSFSVAGKRGGFDDTRGTLFFDIARILQTRQPRYFILENVKGLLSHDGGRTFAVIISTLDELGYDLQWQVLNSKNFGVPQNRERVYIIGHLRGEPRPQVFPIRGTNKKSAELKQVGNLDERGHNSLWGRVYDVEGVSSTINAHGGGLGAKTGLYAIPLKFLERNQKTLQGEYSFTVDTVNSGGVMVKRNIRKLTPVECERLQGFPDNWTQGVSDTQRYKQLGNAVTVNVIRELIARFP